MNCKLPGCRRLARRKSKSYCDAHYARWRKHGDPGGIEIRPGGEPAVGICGEPECGKAAQIKGMCGVHYRRHHSRESVRAFRIRQLGSSHEQIQALEKEQGGLCAICRKQQVFRQGRRQSLHIDHDHKTGTVRGLLCSSCNPGLGMFKDDPQLLLKAANYLLQHHPVHQK